MQSCNDGSRSASQRPVVLGEASRTGVNIHPTKRRESGSQRRGMEERRGDWPALTRALRGGQLIFSLSFSFFKLCRWTFTALESLFMFPSDSGFEAGDQPVLNPSFIYSFLISFLKRG